MKKENENRSNIYIILYYFSVNGNTLRIQTMNFKLSTYLHIDKIDGICMEL